MNNERTHHCICTPERGSNNKNLYYIYIAHSTPVKPIPIRVNPQNTQAMSSPPSQRIPQKKEKKKIKPYVTKGHTNARILLFPTRAFG